MNSYKETFDTWNNIASLYQDKFMNLDLYNESYDHICYSITKQNAKLLDVGCGPGNITKYLLSKRPDFNIFGTDIAPNMIALAKANNPAAEFAVMDSREIKTLAANFDGIVSGFCLPYLSPPEGDELISTSYNLLTEGGLLYLSFVEGNPEESGFRVGSGGRVFFHFHALQDLTTQLIKSGFEEIEVFKAKYQRSETEFEVHIILISRKKIR